MSFCIVDSNQKLSLSWAWGISASWSAKYRESAVLNKTAVCSTLVGRYVSNPASRSDNVISWEIALTHEL